MARKPLTKEQALAKFKEYYPGWKNMSPVDKMTCWDSFIVDLRVSGWISNNAQWVNPFEIKANTASKLEGTTLPKEVRDLLPEIGTRIANTKKLHYISVRISNKYKEVYFKLSLYPKDHAAHAGIGEFPVKWVDLNKYTGKL